MVKPEALELEVYQEGALQVVGIPSSSASLAITKPRPRASARRYFPRFTMQKPNPCHEQRFNSQ